VGWLGAVQSQDYSAAKWAIGLRCQNVSEKEIEQAFNEGRIIRTHIMRPTWHFVLPTDIRWMLALTAPRVHKINSYYYRQLGLTAQILQQSMIVLIKALQNKRYLTRDELKTELYRADILTDNQNLEVAHILMHAELEGVICSGPMQGKQFTYALLKERVPKGDTLNNRDALRELVIRYFQSHGPATLQDFVWWSGLTMQDAKEGIELVKSTLSHETIEGKIYWFSSKQQTPLKGTSEIYLLPNFDEYIVGYTDRKFIFDDTHIPRLDLRANPLFQHTIILDGKIIGTWKRQFKKNLIVINPCIFTRLSGSEKQALDSAIKRFGVFIDKPIKSED